MDRTPPSPRGTALATPDAVSMRRYPSYREELSSRVAARWISMRFWLVLPHALLQLLLLSLAGLSSTRLGCMAAIHSAHALTLMFWQRSVRAGAEASTVAFRSNLAVVCMHAPLIALTGGLPGPLAPSIVGVVAGNLVGYGRSRRSYITIALALALVVPIAVAGNLLGPPSLSHAWASVVAVETLCFSILMLGTILLALTASYDAAGEALDAARTELLDEARSRARALESVGAKVAHELKNPLAAIKALVSLAATAPREEKRVERLNIASAEIERMEALLRAYLEFERPLEALHRAPGDLAHVAAEAVALLGDRAALADVTLSLDAPSPVATSLDARRVKSALVDLVSNAIEASPRGASIEVVVRDGDGSARVEVRDHGRGMSPSELARVGTAFFTTREDGTGLGVVLARLAATQHGGALTYDSEAGRGTRVTLTIPRAEAP